MARVVPIKAWSHSRLAVFEPCPKRAELAYVDRIPEPPRPLPPGKTEHANDRGTRIHEAAEMYVRGGVELIQELEAFREELDELREMQAAGKVSLEGEWAFDRAWSKVHWKSWDAWCRIKCDAVAWLSDESAVVIDYKSGKRYGNEAKHHEQMQLYQLAAFLRYPQLQEVTVELWYTDINDLVDRTYRRDQGLRFLLSWDKRGERMTTAEEFPAKPSQRTCKFCPYKPTEKGGTGHCAVGE